MADFATLHLSDPIAAAVARLGWNAADPVMRDAAPTAARGHNLLAVLPPAPAAATPVLAGLLSRLGGGATGLLLAPDADLDEWARRVHLVAGESELRVLLAHGSGRAARRMRTTGADLLITSPANAMTLHGRSALHPESLGSVLLAWPEQWVTEDGLSPLMQDLSGEAQRIIVTSAPERSADLAERYARRALVVSAPGLDAPIAPSGTVRTVSVPWSRRIGALPELFELLDPSSTAIWTLDRGEHSAIAQALTSSDPSVQIVSGDAPAVQTVIAFDPPTPARLRQLSECGEVVLLMPPSTESYIRRIADRRRPLRLSGSLDAAVSATEKRREAIVATLEKGSLDRALLTLAPLIERYDASAVAAAVFELWSGAPVPQSAEPGATPSSPAVAKVFVGIGKKDGATVNDLVAVLTKEVRVERTSIGRVELRDGYMLVEIPAQDAERVAGALNGTTIRRKRVTAKVDKGSGGGGRRPQTAGRRSGKS